MNILKKIISSDAKDLAIVHTGDAIYSTREGVEFSLNLLW